MIRTLIKAGLFIMLAIVSGGSAAYAGPLLFNSVTLVDPDAGTRDTWELREVRENILVYESRARPGKTSEYTPDGNQTKSSGGLYFSPHNGQVRRGEVGMRWTHPYQAGSESREVSCEILNVSQQRIGSVIIDGVLHIRCSDKSRTYPHAPAITTVREQPPPEYGPFALSLHVHQPPSTDLFRSNMPSTQSNHPGMNIRYKLVSFGSPQLTQR